MAYICIIGVIMVSILASIILCVSRRLCKEETTKREIRILAYEQFVNIN